jgi:putative ABC transport system substrate-binding protein
MLHELVPMERTIGLLVNATNPNAETQSRDLQVAARSLGLQLHVLHANSESDFDKAFAAMAQLRVGALVIGTDGFLNSRSEQLARCYDFPPRISGHLFASLPGST